MKATLKWRHLVQVIVILAALAWMGWRLRGPAPVELRIADSGQVIVDGRTLPIDELGAYIAATVSSESGSPVQVIVDASAPSTVLIPVLDALERSGVHNVQVIANP